MNNTVAKIIKVYAVINGIASVILAGIMSSSEVFNSYYSGFYGYGATVFAVIAGTGIVVSFGIYAVGEIIDLLQGIKNNTERIETKSSATSTIDSTLPPL